MMDRAPGLEYKFLHAFWVPQQPFNVEVRQWKQLVPKIMSLDNAYRPRKGEEDRIPHSFTFRKRERHLTVKSNHLTL